MGFKYKVVNKQDGHVDIVDEKFLHYYQDPVLYEVAPLDETTPVATNPVLARDAEGVPKVLKGPDDVTPYLTPASAEELDAAYGDRVTPDDDLSETVAFGAGAAEALPFVGGPVSEFLYGDEFSKAAKRDNPGWYTGGFLTNTGLAILGLGAAGVGPSATASNLTKVATMGAENAAWGMGLAFNDAYLARNKPGATAESMLWSMGKAGMRDFFIGAGLGGLGVGAAKAYRRLRPSAGTKASGAILGPYDAAGRTTDALVDAGQRGRDAVEIMAMRADDAAPWQKLASEYDELVNAGAMTHGKFNSWVGKLGKQADLAGMGDDFGRVLQRGVDDDVALMYAAGLDASVPYERVRRVALAQRAASPNADPFRQMAIRRMMGEADPQFVVARYGDAPDDVGMFMRDLPIGAQLAEMRANRVPYAKMARDAAFGVDSSARLPKDINWKNAYGHGNVYYDPDGLGRAGGDLADAYNKQVTALRSVAKRLGVELDDLIPRVDANTQALELFTPAEAAAKMPRMVARSNAAEANLAQAYREAREWARVSANEITGRRFSAAADIIDDGVRGGEGIISRLRPRGAGEWAGAAAGVAGVAAGNPILAGIGGLAFIRRLLRLHARDFMLKRYPGGGIARLAAADKASQMVDKLLGGGRKASSASPSASAKYVHNLGQNLQKWLGGVPATSRRATSRGASELLQMFDDDPKDPQALFDKRKEEIKAMAENQGGLMAAENMMGGAYMGAHPELVEAVGQRLQAISEFLAAKLPPEQPRPTVGKVAQIPNSDEEIGRWARYYGYAMNPTSIIEDLTNGTVGPEAAEVMNLFPEVRALIVGALAGDEQFELHAQQSIDLYIAGIDVGDPVIQQIGAFQAHYAQAQQAQQAQAARQRSVKLRSDLQATLTQADRQATDIKRNV